MVVVCEGEGEGESESESESDESDSSPPPKKKTKSQPSAADAQPSSSAKETKNLSVAAAAPKTGATKPNPDSDAGKAALATWHAECAAFVKASEGPVKLTGLGQKFPLPVQGKLTKQLLRDSRFEVNGKQEVTLRK